MTIKQGTSLANPLAATLPGKQFVDEKRLVSLSGMSEAFWQKDRWLHKGHAPGCPYIKVGRSVRYELGEALTWLESGRRADLPEAS